MHRRGVGVQISEGHQGMSSPEIIEEGAEAAKAAKPKSKKKLIIIGAAAGVLLLGGGGGAAFMFSGSSAKAEEAKSEHGSKTEAKSAEGGHGEGTESGKDAFLDVPAMMVNLRSPDGQARFLKLHFMIVPGDGVAPDDLKEKLPLVLDSFQPFLRELRPEDLSGSAAVFRIKEEMMVRATATLGDGQVKDILIQDLVQQ
ncbi:flagellar basal body-associated FliL family protein [Sphingomonas sp. NIBR02145]|uniref:flagellar basal body-associated FliL family protein n=2 Tax=unclassified Sphingomonas TaxID=196159 RepID=UPI0022B5732E|nr:flagellar basal body-associated FliL family protein [Sphingomonas sp. NIBR02145]WHU04780.1 flagellar basal body-associated FliL family protein [Sphingomonas sp. NIBR02145]